MGIRSMDADKWYLKASMYQSFYLELRDEFEKRILQQYSHIRRHFNASRFSHSFAERSWRKIQIEDIKRGVCEQFDKDKSD